MNHLVDSSPPLKLLCAICDKPVDRITTYYDCMRRSHEIRADCHGDSDTMILTEHMLQEMREVPDSGVAFTTKRLEKNP